MTKTLPLMVVLVVALFAGQARAQYSNRSIGIGMSAMKLVADGELIDWGLPLTLEASYYIDNGFDLYLKVPFMLLYQRAFVTANNGPGWVMATGGHFGIRYFFSEESLRPYAGLHLAGLYIFRDSSVAGPTFMGGPGANVGVDFFTSDSVSFGARVYFDLFLALNSPLRLNFGGGLNATAHF